MRRIIDKDQVVEARIIQEQLLFKYGIEASICEIQELYYLFCGRNGCWISINDDYNNSKTWLEAFLEDVNKNLY